MPVDLYIGPKKRGAPWWQGCLLSLLILCVGGYLIVLILASNGIYVAGQVPLPETLRPTPTPTPTPTEPAVNHMQRGDAALAEGQMDIAAAEYGIAASLEPLNEQAYRRMTKPLILLRRYDEAVNAARLAVQINETRAENLGALAEALDWHGDFTEALDLASRAVEADPNYAEGYAFMAEIYADMGRPDKALPAAQKAVKLKDTSPEAHRNLGYVFEMMGQYKNAQPEYLRAVQLGPRYTNLYIDLARNYSWQGNYKDAIATLQQAVKIAPRDAQVYDALGWTFALSGDSPHAIAQLKNAIKADPNYEVPYGHIAYVYFQQQDWEDTVGNLNKALALGGARVEYYYRLGIAYVNLKDCGQGKEWIDRAAQMTPTDQAVQGAISWYQAHCEPTPIPKKK